MLIGGIVAGLVLGPPRRRPHRATSPRSGCAGSASCFLAVIVRFGTEWALDAGIAVVETLRLPLFASSFGLLLGGLWVNRHQPGLRLAFVGILLNTIAIVANGGHMPIWQPSLVAAGFDPGTILSPFHVILADGTLERGLPPPRRAARRHPPDPAADHPERRLDRRPVPDRRPRASSCSRRSSARPTQARGGGRAAARRAATRSGLAADRGLGQPGRSRRPTCGRRVRPATGLASRPGRGVDARPTRSCSAARGARPLGPGLVGGRRAWRPSGRSRRPAPTATSRFQRGRASTSANASAAPSVRPARPQQLVLGALDGPADQPVRRPGPPDRAGVPRRSRSPTRRSPSPSCSSPRRCRTCFLSPIAGTYVDRWDQKDVMVVSDLLRAAIVLMIPIAAVTNLLLVYPLVFLVTSISIFFRPARVAILPRIVREDELLTANSAMWIGETFADVIGYPLAGIFVGFLGAGAAARVLVRRRDLRRVGDPDRLDRRPAAARRPTIAGTASGPTVLADLQGRLPLPPRRDGAPREHPPGDRRPVHDRRADGADAVSTRSGSSSGHDGRPAKAAYGFLETAIGVGNLIGGFVDRPHRDAPRHGPDGDRRLHRVGRSASRCSR